MDRRLSSILGGDPFSDVFRGLYNLKQYWKLTDPEYCVSIMKSAYDGGCRAFDYSFKYVEDMFLKLREEVGDDVIGVGNPTYLQGFKLGTTHLQHLRSRVLCTIVDREGFISPETARVIRDEYSRDNCMVFGYEHDAQVFSDTEISEIYLDEAVFNDRLDEMKAAEYIMIGGTDADWLVTLGRIDLIAKLVGIVKRRGQIPVLICHYTSIVLPAADVAKLDVEIYFAPINKLYGFLEYNNALNAVCNAEKPVIAFMAFANGRLCDDMEGAAKWLRDHCGVSGIMYGTSNEKNARRTAEILKRVF